MLIIRNETDFRAWLLSEYSPEINELLEPDELEEEIMNLMPREFPCIVVVTVSPSPQQTQILQFIYREQVEEGARLLGT